MLSHSFDRFYVVMKIEISKVSDLNLTLFQFDYNCSHVVNIGKGTNFQIPSTIKDMFNVYCKNIIPYMYLYKHQVEYYEKTVYCCVTQNSLVRIIGISIQTLFISSTHLHLYQKW